VDNFQIRVMEQIGGRKREFTVDRILPEIDLSKLRARFPEKTPDPQQLLQGLVHPSASIGVCDKSASEAAFEVFGTEHAYGPNGVVCVAVWTIGEEAEKRAGALFREGSPLEGLLLDTAASVLLMWIGISVRNWLMECPCDDRDWTIVRSCSPGNNGVPLHLQQMAVLLSESEKTIGVSAGAGSVLHPMKSQTGFFLLGEGPAENSFEIRCSECRGGKCLISGMGICGFDAGQGRETGS